MVLKSKADDLVVFHTAALVKTAILPVPKSTRKTCLTFIPEKLLVTSWLHCFTKNI